MWLTNNCVAGIVLCLAAVFPAMAEEVTTSNFFKGITIQQRLDLLSYSTRISPAEDSLFNPENQYAKLPDRIVSIEARSHLTFRNGGPCEIKIAPRFRYETRKSYSSDLSDDTDLFIQTGTLACSVGDAWELRGGRSVLAWGNATFRGPSNPFFTDSGKTDPVRELVGRDLFLIGWRDQRWYISGAVVGKANKRDNQPGLREGALALRADYTASDYSAGLVISKTQDQRLRWGGYSTWTASQSAILYTEWSWFNSNGYYPEPFAGSSLGWRFVQSDNTYDVAGLVGAAYTFQSGWTLTGEVLIDSAAYSGEQNDWSNAAVSAANSVLNQPAGELTEEASEIVGRALQPELSVLNRSTLFLQLQRSEWANRADFAVRLAQDVDAGLLTFSASLNYFLASRWELLSFGVVNSEDSADGRTLHYAFTLGVRTVF